MNRKDISPQRQKELARLVALPDEDIDTNDIPEAPVENWAFARRPALYRPLKQSVTIRLDADVVAWFKERSKGSGYQTEINRVLRRHVAVSHKRRA